jgi:hypothetical protein
MTDDNPLVTALAHAREGDRHAWGVLVERYAGQ